MTTTIKNETINSTTSFATGPYLVTYHKDHVATQQEYLLSFPVPFQTVDKKDPDTLSQPKQEAAWLTVRAVEEKNAVKRGATTRELSGLWNFILECFRTHIEDENHQYEFQDMSALQIQIESFVSTVWELNKRLDVWPLVVSSREVAEHFDLQLVSNFCDPDNGVLGYFPVKYCVPSSDETPLSNLTFVLRRTKEDLDHAAWLLVRDDVRATISAVISEMLIEVLDRTTFKRGRALGPKGLEKTSTRMMKYIYGTIEGYKKMADKAHVFYEHVNLKYRFSERDGTISPFLLESTPVEFVPYDAKDIQYCVDVFVTFPDGEEIPKDIVDIKFVMKIATSLARCLRKEPERELSIMDNALTVMDRIHTINKALLNK